MSLAEERASLFFFKDTQPKSLKEKKLAVCTPIVSKPVTVYRI